MFPCHTCGVIGPLYSTQTELLYESYALACIQSLLLLVPALVLFAQPFGCGRARSLSILAITSLVHSAALRSALDGIEAKCRASTDLIV